MDKEKITLQGTQQELMQVIPQIIAFRQMLQGRSFGTVYGIPVTTFQDDYGFRPQVKLMFYQTLEEAGDEPEATGEITYRVINESEKTINEAKAKVIAEKIKTKFAKPNLFTWRKGTKIVRYLDKEKGYDFRLFVTDESEGRRIIEQVLDLQNHSPEWERLRISESRAEYPNKPPREMIYGELRRLPRRRPTEIVSFRYAELHVHGLPSAVSLVDTTGYRAAPLVSSF